MSERSSVEQINGAFMREAASAPAVVEKKVERQTERLRFEVGPESERQRLDEFLAARIGWLSRLRIAKLIAAGACLVNGEAANSGQRLRRGDVVLFEPGEWIPNAATPEPAPLEIVHEDEDLLVLIKPAGMLVHPTRNVKTGTLANALAFHLNQRRGTATDGETSEPALVRPGLVHRLDRATSGLMVVAKNQRALSALATHFQRRLVKKRYLALVHGQVDRDEMVICAPIGRDEEARPKWRVMQGGKEAETRLRVVRKEGSWTLVELEPVTGRTNQLRIHCAHIGHPIVGDDWYGPADQTSRLCLHAAELGFHHPRDGRWVEFRTPLPSDIVEIMELFTSE
ncbi:MAG: RNA pseudouridine synthase [Pyrinomonas sp.]|uniref:RluA family pseudouridine synthase n=1 Tax=Pyrinomonas sp. TaxID=2080306 RepID=UPI003316966E